MIQKSVSKEVTCYACDQKPLSGKGDHVPPKCIFTKLKDSDGENLRLDLITVPSCEEHNQQMSKDDQFLMMVLSSQAQVNSTGRNHFFKTTQRTIDQTGGDLERALIPRTSVDFALDDCGNKVTVQNFNADTMRLAKCLRKIALGLYYHEQGKRYLLGEDGLMLHIGFINYSNLNKRSYVNLFIDDAIELLKYETLKGKNSKVFCYKFKFYNDQELEGLSLLYLKFYGNLESVIGFKSVETEIEFIPPVKDFAAMVEVVDSGCKLEFINNTKRYPFNIDDYHLKKQLDQRAKSYGANNIEALKAIKARKKL